MTAINHALTGAAIGLVTAKPHLAIPLALISHFICDALPHFGIVENQKRWLRSKPFRNYLLCDAAACVGLVAILALLQPANWALAALCAFIATSPDFLWIPKFLAAKGKRPEWHNAYTKFAGAIQWFQRPVGIFVEIAWFMGFVTIVGQFL